jgi:hypothetical protein
VNAVASSQPARTGAERKEKAKREVIDSISTARKSAAQAARAAGCKPGTGGRPA